MDSAPNAGDADHIVERFLSQRGHETSEEWERDYNKKQCPECGGLHDLTASACSVCGWAPPS